MNCFVLGNQQGLIQLPLGVFVQVLAARTYSCYEKYISIAQSFALLSRLYSEGRFSTFAFMAIRILSETRVRQQVLEIRIPHAGNLVINLKYKSVFMVSRSEKEKGRSVFTKYAFTISQYFVSFPSLYLGQIKSLNNAQNS